VDGKGRWGALSKLFFLGSGAVGIYKSMPHLTFSDATCFFDTRQLKPQKQRAWVACHLASANGRPPIKKQRLAFVCGAVFCGDARRRVPKNKGGGVRRKVRKREVHGHEYQKQGNYKYPQE